MNKGFISVLFVLLFILTLLLGACATEDPADTTVESCAADSEKPKVVVHITPPCTTGDFKMFSMDGELLMEYKGKIDILNNGRNGEAIDIEIHLDAPLFDEED